MLTLENIHKTFYAGTANEVSVFKGLSLHLDEGEYVTVIGSNGAGKSTLFNLIAGTFLPDSGKVTLTGKNLTWFAEHRRSSYIGRLFQDPLRGTAPNMTIEENLALAWLRTSRPGIGLSRVSRSDRDMFRSRLEVFGLGLENRMKSPVGLLSGGQRQALTLLMATLEPPKLLLLDEHTASLDPATAEKVLELTRKIVAENNLTCMMITHNIESALLLGSRTIMMDRGRIVLDISGKEREKTDVPTLLAAFKENAGRALADDRVLLQ